MMYMQHLLRKYKKPLIIVGAVIIIPTFVLWGTPSRARQYMQNKQKSSGQSVIAQVGNQAITAREFREQLSAELAARSRGGNQATTEDLIADGTAFRIVDNLVNADLMRTQAQKEKLSLTQDYLVSLLRDDPRFKDENGKFSKERWNAWVQSRQNWNALYAALEEGVAEEDTVKLATASARVLDEDVRKRFEDEHTQIQVRYVTVAPEIVPTEEQIQTLYDKDPTVYATPERRTADFVAFSLKPPRPALVDELAQRARSGEDFAQLAKDNSKAPSAEQGGDIGWISPGLSVPPYQEVLFSTPVNGVTDPVEGPTGYYIYKVEEERTDEVTAARDVKVREIFIPATLDEKQRSAIEAQAKNLETQVKESGDLRAAAKAAGLTVQTTEPFTAKGTELGPVPREDVFSFRYSVSLLKEGEISDVIAGRANLYVANVTRVEPPVEQPLEAVQEQVTEDTIESIRHSPEYASKVAQLVQDIKTRAKSLEDIKTLFPDLKAEIKETEPFTIKDFRYQQGLFWNPREVYEAVGRGQPGAFAGPIKGMLGDVYFVELVKRTPPDKAVWDDQWPKEKDTLRTALLHEREQKQFEDYLLDLRDRLPAEGISVNINYPLVAEILKPPEEKESGEAQKKEGGPSLPPASTHGDNDDDGLGP